MCHVLNFELARLTLWCSEVDNIAISLEHVDLLNGLDRLDVELFQRRLELLVVDPRVLWLRLDLPSWSTLASVIICVSI